MERFQISCLHMHRMFIDYCILVTNACVYDVYDSLCPYELTSCPYNLASQPTPLTYPPQVNKGLIAGLIKGNQWLIRVHRVDHGPSTEDVYGLVAEALGIGLALGTRGVFRVAFPWVEGDLGPHLSVGSFCKKVGTNEMLHV